MVIQRIVDYYYYLYENGDARSAHLPLVKDPLYVFVPAVAYLVMVMYGPKFMEKRNPLQLRNVLIGYNCFSVVLSIYMMWEFFATTILNPDFNLLCQDIVPTDTSPLTIRLVNAHWLYFFSKLIEFCDTFFFVVRKKNNQISFLHVYHHVSMLVLQWTLVKFVPGGVSYLGPLLNCFIHTLMYTYYMLAAFGPHMQKYLWWKKYLTRMQMVQFAVICTYIWNAVRMDCDYWMPFLKLNGLFVFSLLFLFGRFYLSSYSDSKKSNVEKKE
ncbi:elongation of very long chain fatty acids protein AAEL008004-like isoform X2 [Hydractinia symbiolongicarpus]|uniref:elongation of very long chain fatty acids protein AAEL008004-like isoform X2 n=1 Tax=Hydractinia symbiolongicarpus TaxID=13093 RepID=UPI00254E9F6D|nr:elongation of very long chain fatty acids protein AAEL008004-like isoform X2 [Hydractinia symbiolongicarpus]